MTIQTIIKGVDHPQTGALSLGVVFRDPQDATFKEQYRDVPVFLSGAKTPDEAEALVKAALRAERAKLQTFAGVEPKLPLGVPYDIGDDAPVAQPDPERIAYDRALIFFFNVKRLFDTGADAATQKDLDVAAADIKAKFKPEYLGK
jgi:hypothetical protein